MQGNKMFLDLEKLRTITLMEMIMKIRPNFKGIINVQKPINNLPSYGIKDPRNYHTIAASPNPNQKVIGCWVKNTTINKSNLILSC